MSELALTLLRLGFLALLWLFVFLIISALRRDLVAPADTPIAPPTTSTNGATNRRRGSRRTKQTARRLVVVEGDMAGTILPLTSAAVTLGRATDCSLVLDDDYASSHHAKLYPYEDSWVVEDMGSTNGTWIDRTRITTPTVLGVGQPLHIGRTVLELRT
jgi:pSer/pThr/pTyr-binding forkhead associated (FHA) protein